MLTKTLCPGGADALHRHTTRDLTEFSDFQEIVIGDCNLKAAEILAAEISDLCVSVLKIDANNYDKPVRTTNMGVGLVTGRSRRMKARFFGSRTPKYRHWPARL